MPFPYIIGASGATGIVEIEKSALFKQPSSQTLSRTLGSAGNRRTFTISVWIYPNLALHAGSAYNPYIYGVDAASSNDHGIQINNEAIRFFNRTSGTFDVDLRTAGLVRDIGWLHIVAALDTTAGSNRAKLYINGTEASLATNTQPSLNLDTHYNNASQIIGGQSGKYFDGYMAEFVMVEGSQLTPTSFGELSDDGYWTPLASSTVAALASSGNSFALTNQTNPQTNDGGGSAFTNNNSVSNNNLTPTNTHALLNPLDNFTSGGTTALSNGNLTSTQSSSGTTYVSGTFLPKGVGKWVWEVTVTNVVDQFYIGLKNVVDRTVSQSAVTDDGYFYGNDGQKYIDGTASSYGASYTDGDVIRVEWNAAGNSLEFFKNNASQGSITPTAGVTWKTMFIHNDDTSAFTVNFGATDFAHTPTADFKAISTSNIASATTRTASDTTKYFEATLYEGTGSEQNVVSDTTTNTSAFSWIKNRDASDNHMWLDRVRGVTKDIHSNTDDVQATNAQTVKAFIGGGVTLGTDVEVNTSSESFVLWNWMIGTSGSGSSNEDGSINTAATLVDTTLGLSISQYVGTGSNATVGHGLGVAPEVIIVKEITGGASNWQVYNESIGNTKVLYLNLTLAAATDSAFQDTSPTSTVFSIGTGGDINGSGNTYIAYCFTSSQFIAMGSYTGNGNADGTFISILNSLGVPIQPSWIMIKASSRTSPWTIYDTSRLPYNVNTKAIEADANTAEQTHGAAIIDIVSGGVKTRGSSYYINESNATYVYLAMGTPIIDTDGRIIDGR